MRTFAVHVTHRETGRDVGKPLVIEAETRADAESRAADDGWLVRRVEDRAGERSAPGASLAGVVGTLIAAAGFLGAVAGLALVAQDADANTADDLFRGIRAGVAAVACASLGCFGLLMCLVSRK